MTVGIAPADRIFYSAASGPGSPVVYVGSKTGRDGIHGATMASAEFSEGAEEKRPTVQVGDPFTEKLLLEACLELMATDTIVAIQDMGAAGLTSSSVEMADKGGCGIALDLDLVPQRETGMTPYEIMLSESQERMLLVLKPGAEDRARAIFEKWELDFAIIGRVTETGRLELRMHGTVAADIPVGPLVGQAPEYDRPWVPSEKRPTVPAAEVPLPEAPEAVLLRLLACPDLASKRWIWEQYDSTVMADTMAGPGGDAALVRVHGTNKALAITTDCTPRYCLADPRTGGAQAVAEAWRNLTAVGARPLAVTDNLNFGNPERPPIMGQIVDCLQGMAEACRALDFPVVSGNVSLYNETDGEAILPTPTIGAIGLLDDSGRHCDRALKAEGETLLLIGETAGHVGASLYLREVHGREDGAPPPVDLAAERRNGDFVRGLIADRLATACHDVSDGGLYVAVAEMAMAGGIGADIALPDGVEPAGWLFGEDQARYLVATTDAEAVRSRAEAAGVPVLALGPTGGDALTVNGQNAISVGETRRAHEGWLPAYMARDIGMG
ncbi:MAG: phosphoribosylformylglycinamidine synthase subunit PurL, partial [Inquilinus sp.]|nr:phosphoribosylformylglycinamidine synthase subunit PurL [Inquilinus sp.]